MKESDEQVKWVQITSAEQLVRHYLRWDLSATEIQEKLNGNPLWERATLQDRKATKDRLTQRRRYDAAFDALVAKSENPSAAKIAESLRVDERMVRRWRDGS